MWSFLKSPRRLLYVALPLILVAVLIVPGASFYYEYSGGKSCARCHEIVQPYTDWHASTHRNVPCSDCHGGIFTLDAAFHLNNLHRVVSHLRGDVPEQLRLKTQDVLRMGERCQKCHRQEFADWSAGPHGATYTDIFLNKDHNRQRRLMDDCLRCHAMHFEGGIRQLVKPVDSTGPWTLRNSKLAHQPTMPCLACHQMHREGVPLARPAAKAINPGPGQEIVRPSLALFDRRELGSVPVERLPMPQMLDGTRPVKISPDRRQALCYQCHAPLANRQVGSGDDRTGMGIHEGLSCLACHEKHGQKTRASCANCHPRLSNCGLDVELMDTTFKSTKSTHNIHFAKCADCHPKGVPKKAARNRPA